MLCELAAPFLTALQAASAVLEMLFHTVVRGYTSGSDATRSVAVLLLRQVHAPRLSGKTSA